MDRMAFAKDRSEARAQRDELFDFGHWPQVPGPFVPRFTHVVMPVGVSDGNTAVRACVACVGSFSDDEAE